MGVPKVVRGLGFQQLAAKVIGSMSPHSACASSSFVAVAAEPVELGAAAWICAFGTSIILPSSSVAGGAVILGADSLLGDAVPSACVVPSVCFSVSSDSILSTVEKESGVY